MDEKIFTKALVSLKGNELQMVYTMFCRTNLLNIMSSKLNSTLINGTNDYFVKQFNREIENIKGKKDEELQLELIEEMSKVLNLPGVHYSTKAEIEDRVLVIVNETCNMLKMNEKTFRSLCEEMKATSSLNLIIEWQMTKLISNFDKQFLKISKEHQKEFTAKINDYVSGLPKEQQEEIKQKLGIEEFSVVLMGRKMEASGVNIVFLIIRETTGLSFYNQLLSLFSRISNSSGFTLPLSIVSTPLVIVPALLNGGVFLSNKQNKSLQKRLLPLTIMQIALPYMSEQSNDIPTVQQIINTWNMVYERYRRVEKQLVDQEKKRKETESNLSQTKDTVQRLQKELAEITTLLHAEKNKISEKLKATCFDELRLLAVSTKFELVLDSYIKTIEKIKKKKYKQGSKRQHLDFFDKLKTALEKWDLNVEINRLEKEADKHIQRLTTELCIYYSPFVGLEHKAIHYYEKTQQLLVKQLSEQKEKESMLLEELSSFKQEERYLKKRKANLEKEHSSLTSLQISLS
jgi:hypothetical protein